MLHFRVIVLFMLCIFAVASQAGFPVSAKQPASVKECIENPEKCEEQTAPGGEGNDKSIVQGQAPFTVWDFFKMIFATVFVVTLIYLLLKFINQRNRMFASKRGFIENLGGIGVGANRSVQLVKVGNRILVIGVAESIQLLKEIENDDEIKEILTDYNAKLGEALEPNKWLPNVLNAFMNKREEAAKSESFQSLLSGHLRDIKNQQSKILRDLEKRGAKTDE